MNSDGIGICLSGASFRLKVTTVTCRSSWHECTRCPIVLAVHDAPVAIAAFGGMRLMSGLVCKFVRGGHAASANCSCSSKRRSSRSRSDRVKCQSNGRGGSYRCRHPKHPLRRAVRLRRHDLLDEASERLDPGRGLAAAEQSGLVFFFFFFFFSWWQGRMAAAARLDRGLLIRRDDVLALAQPGTLEASTFRSGTRAALTANAGSRGKTQQRCCHGRRASSQSQRPTVAVDPRRQGRWRWPRRAARPGSSGQAAPRGFGAAHTRSL